MCPRKRGAMSKPWPISKLWCVFLPMQKEETMTDLRKMAQEIFLQINKNETANLKKHLGIVDEAETLPAFEPDKESVEILVQALLSIRQQTLDEAAKVALFHLKKEYLIKGKSDSWAQGNNTACHEISEAILALSERGERE